MKIIEHGTAYYKKRCPYCLALLGYTRNDIIHREDPSPFEDDVYAEEEYIKCLECGNKVVISLNIIRGLKK